MNISINEKNQERILKKVESGQYRSPDEVIAKALELLDESDEALAAELEELQAKLDEAAEERRNGQYTDYDEAGLEELKERIKREGRARLAGLDQQPG